MPLYAFTNGAIQTAYIGYNEYTLVGNTQIYWANTGQDIPLTNIFAAYMNLVSGDLSYQFNLPDATQVSVGQNFLISNNTGQTQLLRTASEAIGGQAEVIGNLDAGQTYYGILKDNTTVDGEWILDNAFSSTAAPVVANLAGPGLGVTDDNKLETIYLTSTVAAGSAGVDIDLTYQSKAVIWKTGTGVANLLASTLTQGFYFIFANQGTGIATIQPAGGLIDGQNSKQVSPQQSLLIFTDTTNYYSLGFGQQNNPFTFPLSIAQGGTGAITQGGALANIMPPTPGTGTLLVSNANLWETLSAPPGAQTSYLSVTSNAVSWEVIPTLTPGTEQGQLLYAGSAPDFEWTLLNPPLTAPKILQFGESGIPAWVDSPIPIQEGEGGGALPFWNQADEEWESTAAPTVAGQMLYADLSGTQSPVWGPGLPLLDGDSPYSVIYWNPLTQNWATPIAPTLAGQVLMADVDTGEPYWGPPMPTFTQLFNYDMLYYDFPNTRWVPLEGPTNNGQLLTASSPGGQPAWRTVLPVTGLATNMLLRWSGTAWVAIAAPTGDPQVLTYTVADGIHWAAP